MDCNKFTVSTTSEAEKIPDAPHLNILTIVSQSLQEIVRGGKLPYLTQRWGDKEDTLSCGIFYEQI